MGLSSRIISPSSAEYTGYMSATQEKSRDALIYSGRRMWGIRGDEEVDPGDKIYTKLRRQRGKGYSRRSFEHEVLKRKDRLLREEAVFMDRDYPEIKRRVILGLKGVTRGISRDQIDERLSQFACHVVDPWVINGLGDISIGSASIRVALDKRRNVMRTTLAHELVHAAMGRLVYLHEASVEPLFWLHGDVYFEGIATDAEQLLMGGEHDGFVPYPMELEKVQDLHAEVSSRAPLYNWAMTDYEPEFGFASLVSARRAMKHRLTRTLAEIQAQAS